MSGQIVAIIVNTVVTGALGYLIKSIKDYNKRQKANDKATMIMLQTNLTNTYYVYEKGKKIPDYVYKNWLTVLGVYEEFGGDDYVHILAEKMKSWQIVHTDILNN